MSDIDVTWIIVFSRDVETHLSKLNQYNFCTQKLSSYSDVLHKTDNQEFITITFMGTCTSHTQMM